MSRREDIDNAIWADPEFMALSPAAKLLYLWSFTNPYCGMSGLYKVTEERMAWELGLNAPDASSALTELQDAGLVLFENNVIWVRTRVKHLRSRSPQMARSVAKDVEKFRSNNPLRVRFLEMYGSQPWLRDELANLNKHGDLREGMDPIHPMEPIEVPGQGQGQGSSSSIDRDVLPEEFPGELKPHLDGALSVLCDLAARHGAKAVTRLSLAHVIAAPARRHKPLVRAAHDFAAWADGKAERRKDVVSGYRNWLDKTDDLATIEHLGVSPVANVVPMQRAEALRKADRWAQAPEYQNRKDAG